MLTCRSFYIFLLREQETRLIFCFFIAAAHDNFSEQPKSQFYRHLGCIPGLLEYTHQQVLKLHSLTTLPGLECCSGPQMCPTLWHPWMAARQTPLSFTISWSLFKLRSIESVMPSNHLNLCHPLLLLPPIFPSIRVFSNESVLQIRWPKYWSLNFSISPSTEYPGLISFRMDWFDLLAVQMVLKSLVQHHHSKTSVLQCSAFRV